MGVKIETTKLNLTDVNLLNENNEIIGDLRSAAYSPDFKKIVGIAMVKKDYLNNKENFKMVINGKSIDGEICELPIT